MLTVKQLWDMELTQLKLERETTEPDPEIWRWSPLELWEYDRMLHIANGLAVDNARSARSKSGVEDTEPPRRLLLAEAGSGIGTKLYLAKHKYNLDEWGYEVSDDYIAKANKLGVRTIKCDLRTDAPPWGKFDIVYIARPFKDDEYESEWEMSVMKAMRRGAVLISAYAAVKPYTWPCFYRAPFRGVWIKPATASQYSAMIARQTMGSDPLVPEPLGAR